MEHSDVSHMKNPWAYSPSQLVLPVACVVSSIYFLNPGSIFHAQSNRFLANGEDNLFRAFEANGVTLVPVPVFS